MPLLLFVVTGIQGVDFGYHPDEYPNQLDPARQTLRTGLLLPGRYNYPSVDYWLSLASALPELANALTSDEARDEGLRKYLSDATDGPDYLLRVRSVFVLVSGLGVLWVYLAVLFWRRNWPEALVAASVLGLSWEVAYHSRWVAPDAVMMQFGALTLLAIVLARTQARGRPWLRLAAVTAGLACGTKYTGGMLLVPVFLAAFQLAGGIRASRNWVLLCAELGLVFSATANRRYLSRRVVGRVGQRYRSRARWMRCRSTTRVAARNS